MTDNQEYELRKKAIFDGMAKRGQERILRIGYDNWEPFEEPKDPRERIFGSASLKASALVREYLHEAGIAGESTAVQKELFDLCRGVLQSDRRAEIIVAFCAWLVKKSGRSS